MIVLCDASPLIFLAKLGRLDLLARLLGDRLVVLKWRMRSWQKERRFANW
jgi:hypothetical protein